MRIARERIMGAGRKPGLYKELAATWNSLGASKCSAGGVGEGRRARRLVWTLKCAAGLVNRD